MSPELIFFLVTLALAVAALAGEVRAYRRRRR